ncbi:serum response factor isoform X2 [Protopterus annectens]|uniref:serum response factor isoform X2 n=1 Tax=Protopterus annectens TaxID=7888 RepID=UPI001CFAE77D|nr:serum response factor isoform X2 [Protopterus annectens]
MLPSHLGGAASGNGAASGQGSTMAGSGSSSSGVSLVRSGLSGRPGNGGGMLGGNAAGASRMSMMGNSGGSSRPGNGAGLSGIPGVIGGGVIGGGLPMCHSGRYDPDREGSAAGYSGSDADSDSGDEDDLGDRRGVKRGVTELDLGIVGQDSGMGAVGYSGVPGGVAGAKPGKKTRGRVKIKMEFIDNKLRRYTTFSKRKTGIMKKAYELSTLTGTQVLLLVASETGHVYTFATRKLQPMITSETGKALIQTCLNSPDSPPRSDPSTDQRMSATGFEETDLTYQVSESDSSGETKDTLKPTFTVANLPGATTSNQTAPTTSTTMQVSSGHSFPITNYLAPVSTSGSPSVVTSANGTILKTAGGGTVTSTGVMQLPAGFTIMPGGAVAQQVPVQAIQVHQTAQSNSASDGSGEITTTSGTVTLPAAIMTSAVPTTMPGHMMYPSPHAVMYASTPGLTDGGLAVLNAFSQAPSAMQVSHGQVQDQGGIPQVFLTGPPGTVQIPVQLHQMTVIGQQPGGSSNLTELQVVNLDTAHNCKSE